MNPNKLTDEQIAARPEPFVGEVAYFPFCHIWNVITDVHHYGLVGWLTGHGAPVSAGVKWFNKRCLLPGENGCPAVPPEFQHEWKEGDGAWVLEDDEWHRCRIFQFKDALGFFESGRGFVRVLTTPAIYIPAGVNQDS